MDKQERKREDSKRNNASGENGFGLKINEGDY